MWKITNYGNSRKLPYKEKCIFLPKGGGFETNDQGVAEVLSGYPFITAEEIDDKVDNFGRTSITELRKLASQGGIKNYSKFNKKELIEKLSEVKINGSNKT